VWRHAAQSCWVGLTCYASSMRNDLFLAAIVQSLCSDTAKNM
jgi:hypothetical protein